MRGHRLVGTVAVACVVATACGGTTSSSTSEAKPSPSATSGPRGKTGLALRDYQVGDCVSWPASARAASLSTTTVVQCTSPHFVEIAGQAEVGPEVIDYPTHDEWASIITKACEPIVAGYLGGVLDPRGRFDTHAIHPTRLLWELTNHILNCAVGYRPQRQLERGHSITMTGSARGTSQTATLPTGSCLTLTTSGHFDLPGDCAQPHVVEVAGVADVTGKIDHFPAPHELDGILGPTCRLLAAQYLEHPLGGDMTSAWLTLGPESWLAGRRVFECLVGHGSVGAYRPVSGSIATGA